MEKHPDWNRPNWHGFGFTRAPSPGEVVFGRLIDNLVVDILHWMAKTATAPAAEGVVVKNLFGPADPGALTPESICAHVPEFRIIDLPEHPLWGGSATAEQRVHEITAVWIDRGYVAYGDLDAILQQPSSWQMTYANRIVAAGIGLSGITVLGAAIWARARSRHVRENERKRADAVGHVAKVRGMVAALDACAHLGIALDWNNTPVTIHAVALTGARLTLDVRFAFGHRSPVDTRLIVHAGTIVCHELPALSDQAYINMCYCSFPIPPGEIAALYARTRKAAVVMHRHACFAARGWMLLAHTAVHATIRARQAKLRAEEAPATESRIGWGTFGDWGRPTLSWAQPLDVRGMAYGAAAERAAAPQAAAPSPPEAAPSLRSILEPEGSAKTKMKAAKRNKDFGRK